MTKPIIPNAPIAQLTWATFARVVVYDGLDWVRPRADLASVKVGALSSASLVGLLERMQQANVDQLWIYPQAYSADDQPPEPTPLALAECATAGWQVSVARRSYASPQGGGWISATRPGVYGIREIYWPARDANLPFTAGHPEGTHGLALSLALFSAAIGAHWFRSGGATGQRLMREAVTHHQAYSLTPETAPPPALAPGRHMDGALVWLRDLTDAEAGRRWLVSLDRNAAYLAAAGMTNLATGPYVHLEGPAALTAAEGAKAGLFFIVDYQPPLGALALGLPDPLLSNAFARKRSGWLSLPTLQLLDELGAGYRILDAYVTSEAHRALEPWYQRLKAARDALLPCGNAGALTLLKRTYVAALGWLAASETDGWDRSQDLFYRPDWYAAIKALSRANLYRKAHAAAAHGYMPIAASTDAWYYLVDEPTALATIRDKRGKPIFPLDASMAGWKLSVYDLEADGEPRALLNDTRYRTSARMQILLRLLNQRDAVAKPAALQPSAPSLEAING
jgi:hypothetical protein